MTFDDYWKRLVAKNPGLARNDTVMRISVISFKRSMIQAFNAGQGETPNGTYDYLKDLFGGFGGKK